MIKASGMIIVLFSFGCFSLASFSAPKGKKTGVTFDKALPEDVSNENFPDKIESFDFPDANLLDLVKAISKLTAINFIIDPTLYGKKISIIAPSSITVAEAYKAFLSALAANGYTVVKSGAFWKIQTIDKSHKDNTEVYSGDYFPNTDQLITRIIKLKYINAQDFMTSIKWLLTKENNKISTHESSNSIILSDYGSVIERIMKIVYEMDVPGSEEKIQIVQIEHASAEELAGMLKDLLAIESKSKGSSFVSRSKRKTSINLSPSVKKSSSAGTLKISSIIPDLRTNALVISANEEGVKRIRELVKKLDTPVDASRMGGVYVYNVLYGTAEEVYNTLMGIKPSDKNQRRSSSFRRFPPTTRSSSSSRTSKTSSQSPLFENVNIMADTNTNSLIISAKNKYDYERVKAVLKKIDVPRDQVFIQAIIVEMIIRKGNNREFNLASALGSIYPKTLKNDKDGSYTFLEILGSSIAGFLSQPFNITNLQQAQFGPGLILNTPIIPFLGDALGNLGGDDESKAELYKAIGTLDREAQTAAVGGISNNDLVQKLQTSFIPLFRLLKTASNVNVLSTPQLTTLDNVPAFIEVGENAPVGLTSTATVGGALSQSSIDRENVTLRLDITPRINPESGTVQMDIKQKFDDFSSESSSASELASKSVRIIKREIQTKMVLNDGETAVLGGLLTDKDIKNESKVPILGDIPVLGWLFKGSVTTKEKRNLLVFITPTIIRGKEHKRKTKEILGKKLEERIHFVKKYMKGKDPHGEILQKLIPDSKTVLKDKKEQEKKRKWFWQKESPDENLLLDQNPEKIETKFPDEEFKSEPSTEFDSEEASFLEDGYEEYEVDEEDPLSLDFSDESQENPLKEVEEQRMEFAEDQPVIPEDEENEGEGNKDDKSQNLDNDKEDFIALPPEDLAF